jgi:hypothetical protein
MNPLTTCVASVTDYLRNVANLSVPVASVADPGYSRLAGPVVAVDAPTLTEVESFKAWHDTATIPVRVIPGSSGDSVGLIALADETLYALRAGGFVVTGVAPATLNTEGPNPTPAYVLTVRINTMSGLDEIIP